MAEDTGNTYGRNKFREVETKCQQCGATKIAMMQCVTGTHRWDCDTCHDIQPHYVRETEPLGTPQPRWMDGSTLRKENADARLLLKIALHAAEHDKSWRTPVRQFLNTRPAGE